MKILILSDTFPPEVTGGAARVALTQARALICLGHQVQVLGTRRDKAAEADIEVDGVQVHRLNVDYPARWQAYLSLYNPAVARMVKGYLQSVKPDVIHAHNIHAYLTYHSLSQAHRMGIPVCLTVHDTMMVTYQKYDEFIDPTKPEIPERFDYRVSATSQIQKQRLRYFPLRNAIIRRMVRNNVDALISPSQELFEVLRANGIGAQRMIHIANGIDAAAFESLGEEQAEFRAAHDLVGKRVILLAGRINKAKGGLQMLRALPRIIEAVPDAMLLILSQPGGYGDEMNSIAESLGIRHTLRFAGWLAGRELAVAFGAADVLVTPSVYFDNFPTVNIEAMAAGTPVVATYYGGSREAVIDGETGFVVNPYDLDALAGRMIDLLSNDELRAEMGARARMRARTEYDWIEQAKRLVDVYGQLRDTHE
jgi:glycosyltransferase involved in cell wall biosynthesis